MTASAKTFIFSVEDMRTRETVRFAVDAEKLGEAFKRGADDAAATIAAKGALRLFRFRFKNGRTGERSSFIGQGETLAEAWGDAVKGTRETFRPKNDGKQRASNGVCVQLPSGRVVSRSIEAFEGNETYDEQRRRERLEEERARLAAEGRVA